MQNPALPLETWASCLRVYNTYRSLTGRSIKKPILEGIEGLKIFMPIFMPGIKIEHKNFPFLEFYGGFGGSASYLDCQVYFDRGGGDPLQEFVNFRQKFQIDDF